MLPEGDAEMTARVSIRITAELDEELRKETVWQEGGVADFADCIMEALTGHDCDDPDVSLDLDEGTLEILATVKASSEIEGFHKAVSTIRSAIHECGGGTPGWESIHWGDAEMHSLRDGDDLVEA